MCIRGDASQAVSQSACVARARAGDTLSEEISFLYAANEMLLFFLSFSCS